MAGHTQLAEQQPKLPERHLALARTGDKEYDTNFRGESGFEVRILFQGENVVRNRKRVFAELAAKASSSIKPEEV